MDKIKGFTEGGRLALAAAEVSGPPWGHQCDQQEGPGPGGRHSQVVGTTVLHKNQFVVAATVHMVES